MRLVQPATARARSNIALAKYWGKTEVTRNLPAVPSISLTLDTLVTETEVHFDPALRRDAVRIDGHRASEPARRRVVQLLDRVRCKAGLSERARVESINSFPTAAGLASSASGFAALAAAATAAAGLPVRPRELSRLARRSSASAARSIWGGFVELPAGRVDRPDPAARPLLDAGHWDLHLIVAVTTPGPKDVGSTEGMERSRKTSPYFAAWLEEAPRIATTIRKALRARDLEKLGPAVEHSTLAFHACAWAARPPVVYWQPGTLAALHAIRSLREQKGVPVYATIDAGPHVKALCRASDAARVRRALSRTPGVTKTMVCRPGPGVEVRRG